jgi:hypothetical protein
MIVNTGANVSIACPVEMEMGHGVPPIQQALDHGIQPSLSADVETEIPSEFFTQMRAVFTSQRVASDALCTWPLPVLIRDFAQGGGCGVGKRASHV